MSHRSTLKRRRERKRRKLELQKQALRLPIRKISTSALIEEIQRRTHVIADVLAESNAA
jgi:hypothetical protein